MKNLMKQMDMVEADVEGVAKWQIFRMMMATAWSVTKWNTLE